MFYYKNLPLAILLLSVSLFGLQACGGGDSTTKPVATGEQPVDSQPTADTKAPIIVSPSLELSPVDYTKVLTITFNENIVANDTDIVLHQKPDMIEIPVTVEVTGEILVIKPNTSTKNYLLPSTDYHLILNKTIKDIAGNPLVKKQYSFTTTAVGNTSGNGGTATKTITFIELNDLHANLVPHTEMIRQLAPKKQVLISESRGGLVRIATKIQEIRDANPNNILMNIGDTYHGGAEALFSNGNSIIASVDALGIDVAVPGNWDFSFGPVVSNARFGIRGYTHSSVTRPSNTIHYLGANAKYKDPTIKTLLPIMLNSLTTSLNTDQGVKPGDDFMTPTHVLVKDGIKIGFIGLTSDILEFMHPMMAFNIKTPQTVTENEVLVKKYAKALRDPNGENVDFVVVMSELGIHKDLALAEVLNNEPQANNDVNIIFSAHTHELMQSYKTSSTGVHVVEPGNDTYLGQMDVSFDANNKAVDYKWAIHPIDNSITIDLNVEPAKTMNQLVVDARKPYLVADVTPIEIPQVLPIGGGGIGGGRMPNILFPQTLSRSITATIGKTTIPLDRKNALESTFNNAYTDLLLKDLVTVDIAITPGFRFDSTVMPDPAASDYWEVENNGVLSGNITVADIYRFIPSPYYLASADTTIENLKRVLEGGLETVFSSNVFKHRGGWMFGYAGLKIDVDLAKPLGQRVQKIVDDYSGTNKVLFDASLAQPFPTPGFTLLAAGCGRPFDELDLLCSLPGFANVTPITDPVRGTNYAASDFLIDQIVLGNLVNNVTTRQSITDASATPMWPDSEFVQPLRGVPSAP